MTGQWSPSLLEVRRGQEMLKSFGRCVDLPQDVAARLPTSAFGLVLASTVCESLLMLRSLCRGSSGLWTNNIGRHRRL